MDNRKIVIWANCQGGVVKYFLQKYFNNVSTYYNYEFIRNGLAIPLELLTCDIIIYQNYSGFQETIYNIDTIIKKLPNTTIKISIPFLQSDIYFPYDNSSHIKNEKTKK